MHCGAQQETKGDFTGRGPPSLPLTPPACPQTQRILGPRPICRTPRPTSAVTCAVRDRAVVTGPSRSPHPETGTTGTDVVGPLTVHGGRWIPEDEQPLGSRPSSAQQVCGHTGTASTSKSNNGDVHQEKGAGVHKPAGQHEKWREYWENQKGGGGSVFYPCAGMNLVWGLRPPMTK